MTKHIKNKRKPNKVMEADQVSELDSIYQDSIETLKEHWEMAHEECDEDIIFDEIMSHYSERLCSAFCVESMDEVLDDFVVSPQTWLYEMIAGGIS